MSKINDIHFSEKSSLDYEYWRTSDIKIFTKINDLIQNIYITPFTGLGRPEPLKYDHSGSWSRRINKEHRLIYRVNNSTLEIIQCRYHY